MALLVRPETPADLDAVYAVHAAAFSRAVEADLYAALVRDGDALPLSRVAVSSGEVVGSVVCSRAWVATAEAGDVEVVALGPVGVLPSWQGRGVARAMLSAVVAESRDAPLLALLGDPAFYGRFGFAVDARVAPPDPAWREHFQVLRRDPSVEGTFRYAPAFDAVS